MLCNTLLYYRTSDYDLVLLDLGLPKRDGFEVMRAVRACDLLQQSQVPIIIISARAIDDAAAQVLLYYTIQYVDILQCTLSTITQSAMLSCIVVALPC
jgi:DNA-binding response OmpR family regulator